MANRFGRRSIRRQFAKLRAQTGSNEKKKVQRIERLSLESLEPRILLSADPLGAAAAAAAAITVVVVTPDQAQHDAGVAPAPAGNGPGLSAAAPASAPGAADVNGDGRNDVVWRHTDGTIAVWEMNGTNIQGASFIYDVHNEWQIVNDHGDFDGDGKTDLLWRNSNDGSVAVWDMNGLAPKAI